MIEKIQNKLPLFWRCFLTYLFCTVMFLMIMLVSFKTMTQQWQESYVQDIRQSFELSCTSFSKDLFALYSLPQALSKNADYLNSASLSNLTTPADYYNVSRLSDVLSSQSNLISIVNQCFLYFRKSAIIITSHSVYAGPDECFDVFYRFEPLQIKKILQDADSASHLTLIEETDVTYNKATSRYLPLMLYVPSHDAVFLFTIPTNALLNYFHQDLLPEGFCMTITGKDGQTLFSSGPELYAPSEYEILTGFLTEVDAEITLKIPSSYLSGITSTSRRRAYLTSALTALTGLLLCFFFSKAFSNPVRKIIMKHDVSLMQEPEYELNSISRLLGDTKEQNLLLKQQLLFNLMARVFSGNPITEAEYINLQNSYDIFSGPIRISILRYITDAEDDGFNKLLSMFKALLPKNFICEPINQQEIGIILPAAENAVSAYRGVFHQVGMGCDDNSFINCGVSGEFCDCKRISTAVQQALFGLTSGSSAGFHIFSEETANQENQQVVNLLLDFRQALINWNISEIERIVALLELSVRQSTVPCCQEIYFGMLMSIKEVGYSIHCSDDLLDRQAYDQSISGLSNFRNLKTAISGLINSRRLKAAEEDQQIIGFITDNCSKTNLSIGDIAAQFGRSEHNITTVLNQLTGKTFSSYLSDIRMIKGARLLRETEMTVNDIAEQCGLLPNSFYRNFKKYYNLTPTEYRSRLK